MVVSESSYVVHMLCVSAEMTLAPSPHAAELDLLDCREGAKTDTAVTTSTATSPLLTVTQNAMVFCTYLHPGRRRDVPEVVF